MFSARKKSASLSEIISYTVPKLHTGKYWYVDFKAYDPLEQKMKRKKYMLDGISKASERRKRANEIIANLMIKLRQGWNPWADATTNRQYTLYKDVIELYYKYLIKLHKTGTIKRQYFSRLQQASTYPARIRRKAISTDSVHLPIRPDAVQ